MCEYIDACLSRNNYSTFSGVNERNDANAMAINKSRNNYSTFSGVNMVIVPFVEGGTHKSRNNYSTFSGVNKRSFRYWYIFIKTSRNNYSTFSGVNEVMPSLVRSIKVLK